MTQEVSVFAQVPGMFAHVPPPPVVPGAPFPANPAGLPVLHAAPLPGQPAGPVAPAMYPDPLSNMLTGQPAAPQVAYPGAPNEASPTLMNQPGRPAFISGFGNQDISPQLNQPGLPPFFEGFGFNNGQVADPTPLTPLVPTPMQGGGSSRAGGTSPGGGATTSPANAGSGFNHGFGAAGSQAYGFYSGFTTPR